MLNSEGEFLVGKCSHTENSAFPGVLREHSPGVFVGQDWSQRRCCGSFFPELEYTDSLDGWDEMAYPRDFYTLYSAQVDHGVSALLD